MPTEIWILMGGMAATVIAFFVGHYIGCGCGCRVPDKRSKDDQ